MKRPDAITQFVLEEFAERARVGHDRLSPEMLLPEDRAELRQYRADWEGWKWSREAGSLWDEAEFIKCGGGKAIDRRGLARPDEEEMLAFFERHSASLSKRYLEVFCLFWIERKSYAQIAKLLKVEGETVRKYVKRLRNRRDA